MTRHPISGRLSGKLVPVALMLVAIAAVLVPSLASPAVAQTPDTLIWAPSGGTGSDGAGTWNNSISNWYDQTSLMLSPWPGNSGTATTYANAIIGDGGTLTGSTDTITVAAPIEIGNLTFGAMSATSVDYNIVDTTAGSNPLILNNVNSAAVPVTTLTSNTTVATHITDLDVNMVAPSAFTLNVMGTGNIGVGGSIGLSTGTNTGAGQLNVGSAPGTGYTGSLYLSGNNNITGTVLNSGLTSITNNGSLGSGPVTLAGGTLNIFQGAIGINIATSSASTTYNAVTGSAGVYSIGNWNNWDYNRGGTNVTAYGTVMQDNAAILTPASVSNITTHQNTFSIDATEPAGLNGTQQLFFSGVNSPVSNTTTPPSASSITLTNIPYANSPGGYSVYEYIYNNGAAYLGVTTTVGTVVSIVGTATNPGTGAFPHATNSAAGTSQYFQLTSVVGTAGNVPGYTNISAGTNTNGGAINNGTSNNGLYALWTGQTASSTTLSVVGGWSDGQAGYSATGTPWIAGVEIVAAPISLPQLVTVSTSSTIDVGAYVTAPTLAGGLTVDAGQTFSLANPSSAGGNLQITGTTTFAGAGGILSVGANTKLSLYGISDGGNGFSTASTGTAANSSVQLDTIDNSATLTGPVTIATTVQGSAEPTGAQIGVSAALGTGALMVNTGGNIFGSLELNNSSITLNGGEISGATASANTTYVNSPLINVNSGGSIVAGSFAGGTVRVGTAGGAVNVNAGGALRTVASPATAAVGSINLIGNTTVSGGSIYLPLTTANAATTLTASGNLTLNTGNAVYSLYGGSTSGLINVTTANSLFITGTYEIDAYSPSSGAGALPNTPGQSSTFDLINYMGTLLTTTGGNGAPLMFTGVGQGGELTFGPGSSPGTGQIVIPPSFAYQFTNMTVGGGNEIELTLTAPGPVTWSGNLNGNWDEGGGGTQNWAAGSFPTATPTVYLDGEQVTFGDTNPITNNPVTNSTITIVPSQVSPGSITFANNAVNYSISGGAIAGPTGIALTGTGRVTLSSANTYSGATAINSGELVVGNAGALGNTSSVTVASGGALQLSGGITVTPSGTSTLPLSLAGNGWASNPAGALDSEGGSNAYPGAITLTGATTINSGTASDTLTLSGGITATTNDLSFTGAGNITVSAAITSTDTSATALNYTSAGGTGTLTLSAANTLAGQVNVNSGTMLLTISNSLGNSTGVVVASGGALDMQGGISIASGGKPVSIAGSGSTGSPNGAIDSVSGANTFGGNITLTGPASIGSSSTATGDGLALNGNINAGSNVLTFIGAGNTAVNGVISGTGASVVQNGTGTVTLGTDNSYANGTTINSGTVIAGSAGSLGSGTLTMNGGTLGFKGGFGIGLNVATNGAAGTFNTITSGFSAGVVPITNWNNMDINHGTAPISSGAAGDTPLPFVLDDSNGNVTSASVTSWIGGNGYGNGNGSTGDTQLLSSGLNAQIANNNPSKITIANIPYSTYDVYVYFWNNVASTSGTEQIATGPNSSSLTTNPLEYFFLTGGGNPTAYQLASTTATPNANGLDDYGIWTNVTGSTLEVLNTEVAGGTPWIAGVEIINTATSVNLGNNTNLTGSSTIDVTGPPSVTLGTLTVSNGSTLNVTGGSDTGSDAYTLNFGNVTLNSNATFNVANNKNGSGAGFLDLGAISGTGYSITLTGPGNVVLTSTTGSTYTGGTNVTNGTLRLNDMLTNSADSATGSGAVAVSGAGTLAGPTNSGGKAYVSGLVTVGSGGTVLATQGATLNLNGGTTLSGGTANFALGPTANGTATPGLINTTSVNVSSASTIQISGNPDATATLSGTSFTYDLVSYSGSVTGFGSLSPAPFPAGPFTNVQLVNNTAGHQIDVTYTAWAEVWNGDANSNWSTSATDVNWGAGVSPTATPVSFINTANVVFGDTDTTSGFNVNNDSVIIQVGGVQPNSVVFSNNSVGPYLITNAVNPNTSLDDTTGIAGSTGLAINGTAGVSFTDGNTFTGAVQVNAGYLSIDTTISPSAAQSVQVNGLGNSSQVTVAAGAELSLGNPNTEEGNAYTYGESANGAGTVPLTISGAGFSGMPNGNVGALSAQGGVDTYVGPIALGGNATINANSSSPADQLILVGGINTAGNALTFNGPGGTTVASSITGSGGSIINTGGTVTLAGNNSFSGGITIDANGGGSTVNVASNSALGTGTVTLAGGGLTFTSGSTISLNVAANLNAGNTSVATLAANQAAGDSATFSSGSSNAYNWNNLTVIRSSNTTTSNPVGSPAPVGGSTPAGSTVSPLALNDSTGAASGASVTAYSGGATYSVAGNGNASFQMLSSWLSSFLYPQANVTISNIPYSQYGVYLYYYNNTESYGVASISSSNTSYYFSTYSNGTTPANLTQATNTNNPGVNGTISSSAYQLSDYAVWTGQTGSTLTATIAAAELGGAGSPGLAGIQIVNEAPVFTNPVSVTADSPVQLNGVSSVTMGPLSIGSNTLTVSGTSIATNAPYSLTFGATTLNGSPDFDVSNNGSGAATVVLGAITDSGSGDGVTINNNGGNGTVVFSAGGTYTGSTTVANGTLRVVGALTSNGGVNVNFGATLSGPTTVGQSASIAGAVTLNGNIAATDGAKLSLTGGLSLQGGGAATFTLAGAPSGQAIIATSGATPSLNILSSQTINIAGLPDAAPGTHVYDLYSYTGSTGLVSGNGSSSLNYSDGSLSLGSTVSGPLTYSLTDTGSQVDLTVHAFALTWNGPAAGAWDTTSFNWQYNNSGVVGSNYVDTAYVTFADNNLNSSQVSNTSGLVTVAVQPAGVNPGQVSFTNTGAANVGIGVDYLVNGGAIGGASTAVLKSGAGNVTLDNNNTYGGGTTISAGTLIAGTTSALGTGAVTLSGGTMRLGTAVNGFGGNGASSIPYPGSGTAWSGTAGNWTVSSDSITTSPFPSTNVLQLTNTAGNANSPAGSNETRNAFYNTQVPVGSSTSGFNAQFVYQSASAVANGAVFILQNTSAGAAATAYPSSSGTSNGGTGGSGMGFSNIFPSVGFEINLLSGSTVGVSWQANGVTNPTVSTPFTAVPNINFASGDPILISLSYNPTDTTLTANFTDEQTGATGSYTNNSINVSSVLGGSLAYVGFGGATGGSVASQQISNFSYAVGGAYANNITLTGGDSSTIDVAANGALSAYSVGAVTVGAGGATTLNVTAATAPSGQAYSLTTGAVALNSNTTFNVANAPGSGAGTLNLGAVSDASGSNSVTINGTAGNTGTVVYTAGSSYHGATIVSGGTLRVNGTVSNTPSISVANGATLSGPLSGGSATISVNPALASGGTIAANNGATFSLTAGLTLPTGSQSNFNLTGTPNGINNNDGLIATSGLSPTSLNITGANTIAFTTSQTPLGLSTASYDLFSYTGTSLISSGPSSGNSLAFTNATGTLAVSASQPVAPFYYTLSNNSAHNEIDVTVGEYTFTWTGATNGNWDTVSTDVNWSVPTAPTPTATPYYTSAAVIFADNSPVSGMLVTNTSGVATVAVGAGGIQPAAITFTNVGAANLGVDYVVGGGAIGGSTGITLNGTGNVTLTGSNTFTGGVTINAGTLIVSSDGTTAGAAAQLGAVPSTATANNIVINGGALADLASNTNTLVINANRGIGLGSNSGGGGTIRVPTGDGAVYAGAIANAGSAPAALTVSGGGALTLAGNSTYSGGTTISSGTLIVGTSSSAMGTGTVTLAGGNLSLGGQGTSGLRVNSYQSSAGAGAWFTTGSIPDPNIASVAAINSFFGPLTPSGTGQSTGGGLTTLAFPASSTGAVFANQGFSGTADYESVLSGSLDIVQGGSYTFQVNSDDGSTLFIDGAAVAQYNGNHGVWSTLPAGASGSVTLSAGVHSIEVGYFQGGGGAQLTVDYQGPDSNNALVGIPDALLFTPNSTQSYSNNLSVATSGSVNVAGSLNASMGSLSLPGTTLSVGSTDTSGNAYSLSFTGLSVSGSARVNVAASSGAGAGTVISTAPAHLAASASLTIGSGTFEFNTTSGSASIGAGSSVTVNSGATLQLVGTTNALDDGTTAAPINNNGLLTETGTSNQTVGVVSGTSSSSNGATVYTGNVNTGDGTNTATLTAAQILQATAAVNPNATLVIGAQPVTMMMVASAGSSSSASAAVAGSSGSSGTSDGFAAIEAALSSGSSSVATLTALTDLASSNEVSAMSMMDAVDLYRDFKLSSSGVTLSASGSGAVASSALLSDLQTDGLTNSEISSLTGSVPTTPPAVATDIGSLSSSVSIGGSTAAVPEPSTLVLAALGLGALGFSLRRRKAA